MSVGLLNLEGSYTVIAIVDNMTPVRLSVQGPQFMVNEIEVKYLRRDVRWRMSSVMATGYFDEPLSFEEVGWRPPDMLTVSLVDPGYQPPWLRDFIAKHMPGVT